MNLHFNFVVYLKYIRNIIVHFIDFVQNYVYFAHFDIFEMDHFVVKKCDNRA